MAVRYSGDAEARISYDARRRCYEGRVRTPLGNYRRTIPVRVALRDPRSPESYDHAARIMFEGAEKAASRPIGLDKRGGRVMVRRVFQSPCPVIGPSALQRIGASAHKRDCGCPHTKRRAGRRRS